MLDNPKQIAAFLELNKAGFTPAASVSLAKAASSESQSKSASFLRLILPAIAYPANISTQIGQIKEVARSLELAAGAGADFGAAFDAFQSPSELITVNIGWECYLKGESKPASTTPALVKALADKTAVKLMADVVAKILPQPVISVMNEVNKILNVQPPSAGGSGTPPAAPAPTLSADLVKRLTSACSDIKNAASGLTGATSAVSTLTGDGRTSVELAAKAFKNAIGISVLASMGTGSSMQGAITAITPTSVLNTLFGGK